MISLPSSQPPPLLSLSLSGILSIVSFFSTYVSLSFRFHHLESIRSKSDTCTLSKLDAFHEAVSATVAARFADFSGTVTPHPREKPRHFCSDEERHGGYITFACLPLRQPVLSLPLPSTPPSTRPHICVYTCVQPRVESIPSYTFSPPIFAPFSRSLPNFVPRTFASPSSSARNDSLSPPPPGRLFFRTAVFK